MQRSVAATPRAPLMMAALLLVLVKSVQFAIDSQALFFYDSGAFILNALGLDFVPYRSYVYGGLIRIFAVPFHSLRAIVAMQVIMGGLTAWLLTFALMRFLRVRAWIAILAGLVFAFGPEQIVYEHMVMAETTAMLAMALFLLVALKYLEDPALRWLIVLSFLGVLLVSLRLVYLPVVLAAAVLFPVVAYFSYPTRQPRLLALALVVSCASTAVFQQGYRHLTGRLAGREPAYHYLTGFFLLAGVAPIVEPRDSSDARVAGAVAAQNRSALPLFDPDTRSLQLWVAGGLVARLRAALAAEPVPAPFSGPEALRSVSFRSVYEADADHAAQRLARSAILRNPLGFLRLGLHDYLGYWRAIPKLFWMLPWENGSLPPPPAVNAHDTGVISLVFGADVSHQHTLNTPSRRYVLAAKYWCVFLLAAPVLVGLAWWLTPANPLGLALLFLWNCLLLTATCLGAVEVDYRYLHPFSFTGIAAAAVLLEALAQRPNEFFWERIVLPQRKVIQEIGGKLGELFE